MELLLLVSLFFLSTKHFCGFSHWEQEGWNSLFILADQEDLEVYIDGQSSGLSAPCKVFFEPTKLTARIELKKSNSVLFQEEVIIVEKDSYLISKVTRDIAYLPNCR